MNEQLKQAIADELNVDPAELTSDKRLQDLEYWDSVMVLSMMVIIGESVGKDILPEEMTRPSHVRRHRGVGRLQTVLRNLAMPATSTIRAIAHALPATALDLRRPRRALRRESTSRRSIACRAFAIAGWWRRGNAPPIWPRRRRGD